MNSQEILIEEFRMLRKEINTRMKLLHLFVMTATIFWLVLIICGIFFEQHMSQEMFYNFMLLIPLIFTGLIFNYQDNQRTLEGTARYLEDILKPKLQKIYGEDILSWEQWFVGFKKKHQFSSSYKTFGFIVPFILPIILLFNGNLNHFQTLLAYIDLFFFVIILINFRYKLYRLK